LLEGRVSRVFDSPTENPSISRLERRHPDAPHCGRAPAPSRPHLPSTPDHCVKKYLIELRAFQPTVNVRRGFGPRFARTKTTASASTPQAGSPLRLSHIQSVGWKRNPNPLVEHRTLNVHPLSPASSYTFLERSRRKPSGRPVYPFARLATIEQICFLHMCTISAFETARRGNARPSLVARQRCAKLGREAPTKTDWQLDIPSEFGSGTGMDGVYSARKHRKFQVFSCRIHTPKTPIASCPSALDGDWAQGVEPKAAQPHPRRRLDRTTQDRPQVATGVAQSLALHFPLWSTPLCSRFPAPLYPCRSRSNTSSSPRRSPAQLSGRRKWRSAPFCFLLLEARASPVLDFLSQKSGNTQGRTPPPTRPILRKSRGAIPSPLAVNPGSLRQEIRDRTASLPANSECAQGFWTSLREDQNHSLRVDPASGVPAPAVAHSVRWLEEESEPLG
jgi:hypothetical protein